MKSWNKSFTNVTNKYLLIAYKFSTMFILFATYDDITMWRCNKRYQYTWIEYLNKIYEGVAIRKEGEGFDKNLQSRPIIYMSPEVNTNALRMSLLKWMLLSWSSIRCSCVCTNLECLQNDRLELIFCIDMLQFSVF